MPCIVAARATKLPWAVPAMTWGLGEEIEAGNKTMGQCKEWEMLWGNTEMQESRACVCVCLCWTRQVNCLAPCLECGWPPASIGWDCSLLAKVVGLFTIKQHKR